MSEFDKKITDYSMPMYPFNNGIYYYLSKKSSDEVVKSILSRIFFFIDEVDMLFRNHEYEIDEHNFDQHLNGDNDNLKRVLEPLSEIYNLIESDGALDAGETYEPDIKLVSTLSSLALDAAYYAIYFYAFSSEAQALHDKRMDEILVQNVGQQVREDRSAISKSGHWKDDLLNHDLVKYYLECKAEYRENLGRDNVNFVSKQTKFKDKCFHMAAAINAGLTDTNLTDRLRNHVNKHEEGELIINDEYNYMSYKNGELISAEADVPDSR